MCLGQDDMHSQFVNSSIYLNPVLTGQFGDDLQMNLICCDQLTTVPGNLSYISASVDYNVPHFGGEVGLLVTSFSYRTILPNHDDTPKFEGSHRCYEFY